MVIDKKSIIVLSRVRAEVFTWWRARPWLSAEKVNERFLSVGRPAVNRETLKLWREEFNALERRSR